MDRTRNSRDGVAGTRDAGRGPRRVLGAITALAFGAAHAQEPAVAATSFAAPDGSRFVLVPDSLPSDRPPLVHWVVVTPAGFSVDPAGYDGLSFAVARAAMNGTMRHGSRDAEAESRALDALDTLERRAASLLLDGQEPPADLAKALAEARATAALSSDPLAWQREMRGVPALDVELSETPEATLLSVTTTQQGIADCARLLLELREDAPLRDVHDHFRQVRREIRARERGAIATLRREARGLAFEGVPTRALEPTDPPLRRATALEVYANTHHPTRSFQVLTGRFDAVAVRTLLERVFTQTALEPGRRPAPLTPTRSTSRQSSIPGDANAAIAVCFDLAEDQPRDTLLVLAEWLAGGSDSLLGGRLRVAGVEGCEIGFQIPFPGNATPGSLLITAIDERATHDASALLGIVTTALADAARDGPSATELEGAVLRATGRRARAIADSARRALHLAIECGLRASSPEAALRPLGAPGAADVRELGARILGHASRTAVTLEKTR